MKDYTSNNPAFSEIIKILETSDPGHADIINPALKQLLQNTQVLKNELEEQQQDIDEIEDKTITSYADLMANTVEGYLADAVAVKEGFAALGGWSIYPEELTQAEYDALDDDLKNTPKMLFIVKKG